MLEKKMKKQINRNFTLKINKQQTLKSAIYSTSIFCTNALPGLHLSLWQPKPSSTLQWGDARPLVRDGRSAQSALQQETRPAPIKSTYQ